MSHASDWKQQADQLDARLTETRGLVRDLTTALENKNRELREKEAYAGLQTQALRDIVALCRTTATPETIFEQRRHIMGLALAALAVFTNREPEEKLNAEGCHEIGILCEKCGQSPPDPEKTYCTVADCPHTRKSHAVGHVFRVDEGKPGGDMTCEVEGVVDGNGVVQITDMRYLPGPEVGPEDKLPCKVSCEGGPSFGAGVKIGTLLGYLARRVTYNNREPQSENSQVSKQEAVWRCTAKPCGARFLAAADRLTAPTCPEPDCGCPAIRESLLAQSAPQPRTVLVCRDRDGECTTPAKCEADGCPYRHNPL